MTIQTDTYVEPKVATKTEVKEIVKEVSNSIINELNAFWVENGMTPQILKVKTFHEVFKCFIQETPNADIPDNERDLRQRLLQEEVDELKEAAEAKDIVGVADALADCAYILFGTAVAYGLQEKLQEIFNEVHASNMSKLDENGQPIFREDGKVIKGPNYFKPDIKAILDRDVNASIN